MLDRLPPLSRHRAVTRPSANPYAGSGRGNWTENWPPLSSFFDRADAASSPIRELRDLTGYRVDLVAVTL